MTMNSASAEDHYYWLSQSENLSQKRRSSTKRKSKVPEVSPENAASIAAESGRIKPEDTDGGEPTLVSEPISLHEDESEVRSIAVRSDSPSTASTALCSPVPGIEVISTFADEKSEQIKCKRKRHEQPEEEEEQDARPKRGRLSREPDETRGHVPDNGILSASAMERDSVDQNGDIDFRGRYGGHENGGDDTGRNNSSDDGHDDDYMHTGGTNGDGGGDGSSRDQRESDDSTVEADDDDAMSIDGMDDLDFEEAVSSRTI